MRDGETYRCPDPNCGCEVRVTKGAKSGAQSDAAPTCGCGKKMTKSESRSGAAGAT